MSDLEARAEAVRVLAGLVRAGMPLRVALLSWCDEAPSELRPALVRLARRIRLGTPISTGVRVLEPQFGEDAAALAVVVALHARLGGRVDHMLQAVAAAIDRRREALASARATSAGAKLSARLIAGLPLAFVPLAPSASGPRLDEAGVLLLAMGALLAIGGMTWIARLLPRPDLCDDGPAVIADLLASLLKGGATLEVVLDAVAESAPHGLAPQMKRAQRRVRLGESWPAALRRSEEEGLRALGSRIREAQRLGVPISSSLEGFATTRRLAVATQFEVKSRRAAVLMMIPLALCVLPSFVLLAVAPFLRGLAST